MDPLSITRRGFTLGLLAGAPLTSLVAAAVPANADEPADPLVARSEALSRIVRTRYGKFLTPEQLIEVEKAIVRKQRHADVMREVRLKNSDEPAFMFRADV